MAAQILSGSGNVSYTNSTGQNVRLVINFLRTGDGEASTMTFQGVTCPISNNAINGKGVNPASRKNSAIPFEIALSNGESFSLTNSTSSALIEAYNIIIIPEAG